MDVQAHRELLRTAKAIWEHLEAGRLVRDTSQDHEPGWAMKQIPLVLDLAAFDEAIKKAETCA